LDATLGELGDADIDFTSRMAVASLIERTGGDIEELGARAAELSPPEEVQSAHDHLVDGLQDFAASYHEIAGDLTAAPPSALAGRIEELGSTGAFDPTRAEAARMIRDARREFRERGYEFDPANEGYATEGPGDPVAGRAVFASAGCASCHALADADAAGVIGPDLDASFPPYGKVVRRVTDGRGAMPSFTGTLTEQQIADVAAYVSSVAGS
jgi:mono/diheme cytochrome c family protein